MSGGGGTAGRWVPHGTMTAAPTRARAAVGGGGSPARLSGGGAWRAAVVALGERRAVRRQGRQGKLRGRSVSWSGQPLREEGKAGRQKAGRTRHCRERVQAVFDLGKS